jgi:hypothetical protein
VAGSLLQQRIPAESSRSHAVASGVSLKRHRESTRSIPVTRKLPFGCRAGPTKLAVISLEPAVTRERSLAHHLRGGDSAAFAVREIGEAFDLTAATEPSAPFSGPRRPIRRRIERNLHIKPARTGLSILPSQTQAPDRWLGSVADTGPSGWSALQPSVVVDRDPSHRPSARRERRSRAFGRRLAVRTDISKGADVGVARRLLR